ncbi:MAG: type III-A CRISPR-associated RAMP protein Csm5 [Candidatus Accumulibacter sp.]|jgi:CRISPR-associated protein Csm5|nr:type III-A CRISPR-associated RAMP protein Csm5 [Accumulibacter sp.]
MNEFLTCHKIALTPLSPIHIGCGEDFEPTNYVIDAEQKLLYGFDPSRVVLPEDSAKELAALGEKGSCLDIQGFFRDNMAHFKPFAHVLMPVANGIAADYRKNIGRGTAVGADGRQIISRLSIERHTHSRDTPYVPGSSLKGALRTALMDRLNNRQPVTDKDEKKNSTKLARRLLDGDFATSPLRLLKVSDLMPGKDLDRSVLYAVNRYKRPKHDRNTGQEKSPKGIVARKECILPGQYRALVGKIVVQDLGDKGTMTGEKRNVPRLDLRPRLAQIAKDSNAYHLPRLRAELAGMDETGLVDPGWKQAVEDLLKSDLAKRLEERRALLVRLGRYGGAESKTLTQVAEIKIMGKQGQPPRYQPQTTTYWLAAQTADDRKHLIPFGWAILEIDPQDDWQELKAWCEREAKNRPDMKGHHAALALERMEAETRAERQRAERETAQAAQRQAEAAAAERESRLAAMSEAEREVEKFIEHFRRRAETLRGRKERANGADHQKASALARQAHESADWTASDKKAAAAAIEEWLPKVVGVDMKEVRKKLKLEELKT